MERRKDGLSPKTAVAVQEETDAVCGLASWSRDPIWPGRTVVDLFCHPNAWESAGELLALAPPPEQEPCVAYCEPDADAKKSVLDAGGYTRKAILPGWLSRGDGERVDMEVWERT